MNKILIGLFIGLLLVSNVFALPPDDNNDGCVSLGEISSYVNLWLNNQGVTLDQVSSGVLWWVHGCTSTGGGGSSNVSAIQFLGDDRAIDWDPGIPGGIPNYPVSTTLPAGSTVSQIQTALNNAPSDTAVLLSSGTYTINTTINIPSHKVLRGSGVDATIINCTGSGCIAVGRGSGGGTYVNVTGGFEKGSKQITVSNAASFVVGSYGDIRQDWDDSYFHCGYDNGGICPSWGYAAVGQAVKIIAKSGNTLTLEEPLYFTYTAAFNPRIAPKTKYEYVGLENLRVEKSMAVSSGTNIGMGSCAYCWIKNVWSEKAADFHVDASLSYKSEIRDSVFNGQTPTAYGQITYGVRLSERTSNTLVENNIFNHLRHSMAMERGPSGNVWGYSYSRDPYSSADPNWLFSDIAPHGHYPTMNLYEGNIAQLVSIDNVWGTNGPTTIFRNRIERNKTTRLSPIEVNPWNPYQNIIANDLALHGQISNNGPINLAPDIASTTLVHGNYDYGNGNITKWDSSLSQTLPLSLYLSQKPSWWGNLPWPAFGPDTSHANQGNTIPAKVRFEELRARGKI
jgi:hypothetical protein